MAPWVITVVTQNNYFLNVDRNALVNSNFADKPLLRPANSGDAYSK